MSSYRKKKFLRNSKYDENHFSPYNKVQAAIQSFSASQKPLEGKVTERHTFQRRRFCLGLLLLTQKRLLPARLRFLPLDKLLPRGNFNMSWISISLFVYNARILNDCRRSVSRSKRVSIRTGAIYSLGNGNYPILDFVMKLYIFVNGWCVFIYDRAKR